MQTIASVWLLAACLVTVCPDEIQTSQAESKLERFEFERIEMGVPFKIALYAPDKATANKAADAAYARIRNLNRIMSDYDAQSEVMRLCRTSGPGKPVKVSRELLLVLSRSLALSKQTDGAFDVTVGPLTKLWRRARRQKKPPPANRLAEARKLVGFRFLQIDEKAGTVELLKPGMRLDLGGIAKGYAADEALAVLRKHGITRALIDGSGDIVVGDPPPGTSGWRIGIAPLDRPDRRPSRFLRIKNAAVATSGDAFQFLEIDGRRYSHIIDPRTGLGLTTRRSVTVIARHGITADSLASAVSVLSVDCGLKLIDRQKDAAALIVELQGNQRQCFSSSRWDKFAAPTD